MTHIFDNNLIAFQIIIACFLDLIIGDPYWFPHPVKGIGRIIQCLEFLLRRINISERFLGIILTSLVVSCIYFITLQFVNLSLNIDKVFQIIINVVLIYFTLSIRGLIREARIIIRALERDDLIQARKTLSNLVGRDTDKLKKDEIGRACIESLAENMVDGIISPLFYAFVGGAPLAMAYKAINTLDSMVGYKNKRYLKFGWASARLDDVANFIPARIARWLIPISALICAARPYKAFEIAFRDGYKHPSPNSGIPEAAFAGALNVQLGGPSSYQGVISNKPLLGDPNEPISLEKIKKAIHMVYVTSFLAVACGCAMQYYL